MKNLLTVMLGVAFVVLLFNQCRTTKEKPQMDSQITYLEYWRHGMRGDVQKKCVLEWENETKRYKVTYENYERSNTVYSDAKIGDEVNKCLKEGKVYKYKKKYSPSLNVKDGDTWSFKVLYANGYSVKSEGWIKKPKDFSGVERTLEIIKNTVERLTKRLSGPSTLPMISN